MSLIREFDDLIHQTLRLWLRFLPQVGTWLVLGWLLYTGLLVASAVVGSTWGPMGSILFVLGVTAHVVGVIFAVHSLKPGLTTPSQLADDSRYGIVPRPVFTTERKIDVAILTVGPVLGVYALWAVVDQMIRDGLVWNTVIQTIWNASQFSIPRSVDSLPFYLILGGVALALRVGYGRLVRNHPNAWWRVPLVFLEGLWVFATFFIVLLGLRALSLWAAGRAFWRESLHTWHAFVQWLPDLTLPFDLTLPEFLQHAAIWLTETLLPGLWQGIALPLMWLALVAIVFGWREFRAADLLNGRLRDTGERLATNRAARSLDPVWRLLTADLRDKYLPLLHALRLIWHSGPVVLGAYLVLAAIVDAASHALNSILLTTFGTDTPQRVLGSFTTIDLIDHLLTTSLALALYTAVFDRGLADAVGIARRDAALSRA